MSQNGNLFNKEQNNGQKKIGLTIRLLLFAFLTLVGIIGLVYTLLNLNRPFLNLSETAYGDFDTSSIYYMDEIAVMDAYAEIENTLTDQREELHLLIYFFDRDGVGCYASLNVTNTSPLWERCNNYTEDLNAVFGDLILTGYFSCTKVSGMEDPLPTYYKETYDLYRAELDGINLEKHFVYHGATATEATELLRGESLKLGAVQGIFIAIGLVGLIITLRLHKKNTLLQAEEPSANEIPVTENAEEVPSITEAETKAEGAEEEIPKAASDETENG